MNIKLERIKKGIKQQDFAQELGISRTTLVRIEKGDVEPRRDLIIKIAKALDSTVQELFFND